MPKTIIFTHDCECGGKAINKILDFSQEDGDVEIDIEFSCSQLELECESCGTKYYTGDIEILSEDEL